MTWSSRVVPALGLALLALNSGCTEGGRNNTGEEEGAQAAYGAPVRVGWFVENKSVHEIEGSFQVFRLNGEKEYGSGKFQVPAGQFTLSSGPELPTGTLRVEAQAADTEGGGFEQALHETIEVKGPGSLDLTFDPKGGKIAFTKRTSTDST